MIPVHEYLKTLLLRRNDQVQMQEKEKARKGKHKKESSYIYKRKENPKCYIREDEGRTYTGSRTNKKKQKMSVDANKEKTEKRCQ